MLRGSYVFVKMILFIVLLINLQVLDLSFGAEFDFSADLNKQVAEKRIKRDGSPQSQCSQECRTDSRDAESLCATDGYINVTFNSQCLLRKYNCEKEANFTQILDTSCPCTESRSSPKWKKYFFGDRCPDAVTGGHELGEEPTYVARLPIHETFLAGKLLQSQKRARVPLNHAEPSFYKYEVLCGGSTKWVEANYGDFPQGAVAAAKTFGDVEETIYVCRALHGSGSLIPGKLVPSKKACYIANQELSVFKYYYEVLVQNSEKDAPKWLPFANGDKCENAVVAGREIKTNESIYIARVPMKENALIGKIIPSHNKFFVPLETGEYSFWEYELLCGGSPIWIAASRGGLPKDYKPFPVAETIGNDKKETIYICQANEHTGAIVPGKLIPSTKICHYPTGQPETSKIHYNVLVFH